MSSIPLVSVIIPLYNAEHYIKECLDSILAQSYKNMEIIIVNDGSTDNSLTVARQYDDDRIQIIDQTNAGASAARNAGLNIAQGKYIQFMDADDLLSTNKIEEQVKLLEHQPDYVALCGTVYFDDGNAPYYQQLTAEWFSGGSNNPVDFLTKLYGGDLIGPQYGGMIQPNAWLTPAHIIKKAGNWNEMRNPDDDGEFFCRVLLAGKGVAYAPTAVNYYRKLTLGNNLSSKKNYEDNKNILLGTISKRDHLLMNTQATEAKLALSRLFWEEARRNYPQYKDLSLLAEKEAVNIYPHFKYTPYKSGVKSIISRLLGWKTVRLLQQINLKLRYKGTSL